MAERIYQTLKTDSPNCDLLMIRSHFVCPDITNLWVAAVTARVEQALSKYLSIQ